MFNPHISEKELTALAKELGFNIQHECGGYRVYKEKDGSRRDVFPNSGICPTAARLGCYIFLLGVAHERLRCVQIIKGTKP